MNVSIAPSSIALSQARPITVAVLAMGGQGGGVLVDWIVALAEQRGWFAQSTSVPGVAQRTGATIYYIEMIAPDAEQAGALPRAVADAGAGQGRHRDRRRIDGSRPRHPARTGLARPHAVDRLLAPLLGREREDRARRWHRRRLAGLRGGECRGQPLHRVRHGRDRGRHRQRGFLGAVRRARGLRRPAVHDRGF